MKDTVSLGLQSVALALIFMPEPFTTMLGVALLGYAKNRRVNKLKEAGSSRPPSGLDFHYHYKVSKGSGDSIAYRIAPIREGQLSKMVPRGVSLSNQPVWQAYRSKALQYHAKKFTPSIPIGQLPKVMKKSDGLIAKPQEWQAYRYKTLQQIVKKAPLTPSGLLPTAVYKPTSLIQRRQDWQAYRQNSSVQSGIVKKNPQQFSGLQKGLFRKP